MQEIDFCNTALHHTVAEPHFIRERTDMLCVAEDRMDMNLIWIFKSTFELLSWGARDERIIFHSPHNENEIERKSTI